VFNRVRRHRDKKLSVSLCAFFVRRFTEQFIATLVVCAIGALVGLVVWR
jgi:hypothetical protein